MTQTTRMSQQRNHIPALMALVLGVIITVAVGVALIAARNDPGEPTWDYLGRTRGCDELTVDEFASQLAFAAWEDQCRG